MTESIPVIRGATLKELLAQAHDHVIKNGVKRESSRGTTFSVSALTLVWQNPSNSEENHWSWTAAETDFYQRVFVEAVPGNQPERLADKGDYLFPYIYAARSRFWDGGWGYLSALIKAIQQTNGEVSKILETKDTFLQHITEAGELVHIQVIMAVWDWLGRKGVSRLLEDPSLVESFLKQSRVDQLERVITEIGDNPLSRRAVTVSFVYPDLDQRLHPLLGIPPYQFFQLLPGEAGEPLNSFHVHRSLDAGQGVQLDFLHDFHWLAKAAREVNRPMGTITITAGDFHVYLPSDKAPAVDTVENWLMGVTDGYQAGTGQAAKLLNKENYLANAGRIYQLLGEEQ